MAYSIIKTEQGANAGNGYYTEYLCESADDIATLPTEVENGGPRPGSLAYIEDDSSARYILKISKEWGEYPMAGGGGGGSTGGGYDAVIRLDTLDRGATWTGTLESGTFEAIQAKAEAGEMFSVGAYYRNANGTDMSIARRAQQFYTNYVAPPLTGTIVFFASLYSAGGFIEAFIDLACEWNSDGTISVVING